jgi:Helix-turn-helix domain
MEDELLTVKQFALLIKMHYNSVIRNIKSGRIKAFRISAGDKAAFRIPRSEIHRIAEFYIMEENK